MKTFTRSGLSRRRRAHQLRLAIDALPMTMRRAMLDALTGEQEVIVGAYADREGRVCPMVAAHRRGARAHVGAFPAAWDAFAGARRPRPATGRERDILVALLQESVVVEHVAPVPPRGVTIGSAA